MSERLLALGLPSEYFADAKHLNPCFVTWDTRLRKLMPRLSGGADFNAKPAELLPLFRVLRTAKTSIACSRTWRLTGIRRSKEKDLKHAPAPAR